MQAVKKKFVLPFCGKIIGKLPKMKYDLEVLDNGLIVTTVKIINPYNQAEEIECKALIDTGSENTFVSKSVFDKFTIDNKNISKRGVSTINKDELDIDCYPFIFKIPNQNLFQSNTIAAIFTFPEREYEAIIGIDILIGFELYYSGCGKTAWIEF